MSGQGSPILDIDGSGLRVVIVAGSFGHGASSQYTRSGT